MTTKKIDAKAAKSNLTAKDKFNAMSNATHIFAFKEEKTEFQLLDVVNNENGCKAVVMVPATGEIVGLFTDSQSAKDALNEVLAVFGDDQPVITMNMRETKKGASVYYVEVK